MKACSFSLPEAMNVQSLLTLGTIPAESLVDVVQKACIA
jgi:hypothetical protein